MAELRWIRRGWLYRFDLPVREVPELGATPGARKPLITKHRLMDGIFVGNWIEMLDALKPFKVIVCGTDDPDYGRTVTIPLSPSTVIRCPCSISRVPLPVPNTAGIPYSRATMEPWAVMLPMSVTRPVA